LLPSNDVLANLKVPLSWGELTKRTLKEFLADDAFNLGAQQAYYFFFALFPALLTVISIASFFPIANLTGQIVDMLGRVVPPEVLKLLTDQIKKISDSGQGGILTFAFLLTLWSSSGAMVSIITTLNTAYDITDSRPWWKVRLTAVLLTIGIAFFILTSISLVMVGPGLAEHLANTLGLGDAFKWTWWVVQWPIVLGLVALAIGLVYYFAPDAEQDWVWITPGSIVATVLWLLVSLGFKLYVTFFGSYNATYGSIGAVIVLLTWLYLTSLAILLGAEMNAEIEHASPYGKAVGEKVMGERRALGVAAEKRFQEKQQAGQAEPTPFPDDVNCDLDEGPVQEHTTRASDWLLSAAAFLPVAIRVAKEVRSGTGDDRAA